jgi:hypothetical protein
MTASPRRHACPRRAPGLVHCELPEDLLLHAPGSSTVQSLNQTARAVWELCDGQRSVEAIALDLGGRFQAPPDAILAAIEDVVQRLAELGLLEWPGSGEVRAGDR